MGARKAHQGTVHAGEALLLDLSPHAGGDLVLGAGAKVEGDDLSRPRAKASSHIIAGDNEVLAGLVLTANDDMAVRMTGVEVVDRHPVKLRAQVLLSLIASMGGGGPALAASRCGSSPPRGGRPQRTGTSLGRAPGARHTAAQAPACNRFGRSERVIEALQRAFKHMRMNFRVAILQL